MSDMNDNPMRPMNNEQPEQSEILPPAYYAPPELAVPTVAPFKADIKDGIFALFAFVLGYFFCRWVLASVFGWGVAVFTVVYLGSVLFYLLKKGAHLSVESWFWFAVTLMTGLSFALWNDIGIMPLRNMFLFCSAVYWVMAATATQLGSKTSNFLFLDGLNAVCVIPFRNFINQYRALGVFKSKGQKDRKKALSVLLGIGLALIVLLIVTPQLLKADSGGFSNLIQSIFDIFRFDWTKILEFLFYCFLAVPTAAYLFGLISGSAAKRGTDSFTAEKAEKTVTAMKIAAPATVYIILGTVSVLYIIFIACQIPYFFSAFSGIRPNGWLSYSDYARQGFFELCSVVAINLALLTIANILSKKSRVNSAVLKIFNIVLALITLLLIATAFSKMALYIDAFGLTILRILPCVFMVLLAVVCVGVIVMQKLQFSIVRMTLITGAVLFTALCLADADALVVRYNTDRYLAGSLASYDTDILYRSGTAGVIPALDVYNASSDKVLKDKITQYLMDQKERIVLYNDTFRDTLQNAQAWENVKDLVLG